MTNFIFIVSRFSFKWSSTVWTMSSMRLNHHISPGQPCFCLILDCLVLKVMFGQNSLVKTSSFQVHHQVFIMEFVQQLSVSDKPSCRDMHEPRHRSHSSRTCPDSLLRGPQALILTVPKSFSIVRSWEYREKKRFKNVCSVNWVRWGN